MELHRTHQRGAVKCLAVHPLTAPRWCVIWHEGWLRRNGVRSRKHKRRSACFSWQGWFWFEGSSAALKPEARRGARGAEATGKPRTHHARSPCTPRRENRPGAHSAFVQRGLPHCTRGARGAGAARSRRKPRARSPAPPPRPAQSHQLNTTARVLLALNSWAGHPLGAAPLLDIRTLFRHGAPNGKKKYLCDHA